MQKLKNTKHKAVKRKYTLQQYTQMEFLLSDKERLEASNRIIFLPAKLKTEKTIKNKIRYSTNWKITII